MPRSTDREHPPSALARAIIETLAYADVFDYPLTIEQVHRYLVRTRATLAEVKAALSDEPWLAARIERHGEFVCLAGRSEIIPLRRVRAGYARPLWRAGRTLAWLTAHLPFVRMVAMIGSLTSDNARAADDDIDLFIVTAPGRVWLTRALVIGLVRLAALRGVELCPNYVLSSRRLRMPPDDLFTARELAQMIPLYGPETFAELLAANPWLAEYLPNARPQDDQLRSLGPLGRIMQRSLERALSGRLGDRLEARIQARKLTELRRQALASGSSEVELDAEVCKGHMASHGGQIRARFAQRLRELEQDVP